MKGGRPLEDIQIYKLLKHDAESGMRKCIAKYYALVYSICSGILQNNPQDIEECVNTSFFRLWQTIDKLKSPHHLRAYLCRISRNTALSRYRKLKKQPSPTDEIPEDTADFDFIQLLDRRANSEALQRAIMALKEPEREIFVRKYYYMESMQSLAKRFGMSVKAIDNTLYRTKRRLQKHLEGEIIS